MNSPRIIKDLDDLKSSIGQEVAVSDWLLIDQARIQSFADVTEDHQWIHLDAERCRRESPYKAPIAHGYLVLSLIPFLAKNIISYTGVSRGINYGSNKVRFTNMVPVGSKVRARQKLLAAEPRKDGGMQLTNEVTIEIDGQERPACVAEVVSLVFPG